MGVFDFISNIFKPVADLVDNVTTSDEERMSLNNALATIENNIKMKTLELEAELLKAQSSIIIAEAQGESWIQRNWRPVTMLAFVSLVALHWLGLTPDTLTEKEVIELLDIVEIGLGGYVVGRSAEKIVSKTKWGK